MPIRHTEQQRHRVALLGDWEVRDLKGGVSPETQAGGQQRETWPMEWLQKTRTLLRTGSKGWSCCRFQERKNPPAPERKAKFEFVEFIGPKHLVHRIKNPRTDGRKLISGCLKQLLVPACTGSLSTPLSLSFLHSPEREMKLRTQENGLHLEDERTMGKASCLDPLVHSSNNNF